MAVLAQPTLQFLSALLVGLRSSRLLNLLPSSRQVAVYLCIRILRHHFFDILSPTRPHTCYLLVVPVILYLFKPRQYIARCLNRIFQFFYRSRYLFNCSFSRSL